MSRLWGFVLLGVLWVSAASAVEITYTAATLRDPFSERVEEKPVDDSYKIEQKLKAMTIQGIVMSSRNTRAIINGKIYRTGDTLDVGKITRIDRDGVMVLWDKKEVLIQTQRKPAYAVHRTKK